jgi:hypothetical protein
MQAYGNRITTPNSGLMQTPFGNAQPHPFMLPSMATSLQSSNLDVIGGRAMSVAPGPAYFSDIGRFGGAPFVGGAPMSGTPSGLVNNAYMPGQQQQPYMGQYSQSPYI